MAFKVVNTEAKKLLTKYGNVDVDNPNQEILEKLYGDGSIYVAKEESKETKKIEAQKEEPKEEKKK